MKRFRSPETSKINIIVYRVCIQGECDAISSYSCFDNTLRHKGRFYTGKRNESGNGQETPRLQTNSEVIISLYCTTLHSSGRVNIDESMASNQDGD